MDSARGVRGNVTESRIMETASLLHVFPPAALFNGLSKSLACPRDARPQTGSIYAMKTAVDLISIIHDGIFI